MGILFVCFFPVCTRFFSFDGFVVDEERDVVLRKRPSFLVGLHLPIFGQHKMT